LLENQDAFWEMTPDNFRTALRSLHGYRGIVAMIGGNPCMHRNFEELCQIFREEVPNKAQRGLWTNNYFKHREVIEKTFGTFNLNAHGVKKAAEQLTDLANTMRKDPRNIIWNYADHADHAPLLTAVKDLYPEDQMWDRISKCDINQEWSASIVQNKGELRYYFCEVAASFDLARNEDHGYPIEDGWWKKHIMQMADQVKRFCPGCGVPAKQKEYKDYEEVDEYTDTNRDIAEKSAKQKKRKIIYLKPQDKIEKNRRVTEYGVLQ
jgi:organic radical activating enzyme